MSYQLRWVREEVLPEMAVSFEMTDKGFNGKAA